MTLDKFRRIDMQINRANDYQIETQFAKEGDYNGRELVVQITNAGEISSQNGVSLNLGWKHNSAGNSGLDPFKVVDASKGIFKITYPTEMLIAGDVTASIQILDGGKITLTRNFKITVEGNPITEDAIVSENSFTALTEALVKVNDLEDNYAPRLNEVTAQLVQTANEIMPASKYGFIADYMGIPLYDGQDSSRTTCTDNTQAFSDMLDDCIAKKELKVYFPAGHYGIKLGQVQKDLTGCKLTLIGDGMDLSIIDFVKEDNTNVDYVDETKAKYIAKIKNAEQIIFKDMWIKATTNYNNVNGDQLDINAVYYGAVWGFILDKFNLLKLERTRISNFNYRGISTMVTGATTYNQMSEKILVDNCDFHTNRGCGLWAKDVKEMEVVGGEYHHNGQRGTTGTGYGITASSRVGNLIIRGGARFHHNFRKGFDTHGCINVTVDGATCEDNVLYHFAILGWNVITSQGDISINNLTMSNGYTAESKAWLDDAYNAIRPLDTDQKTGLLFGIDERLQDGSIPTSKIKNVKLNNVKVLSHYNGYDKNPNINRYLCGNIYASTGTSSFVDCDFDLDKITISTNNVYGASLFERISSKFVDRNFKINMPVSMTYGNGKFGAVYISGVPSSIEFDNVNFNLSSGYLLGNTHAGEITNNGIGDNVLRKYVNCLLEWDTFPPVPVTDNKILGSMTYLSNPKLTMKNNVARIGDKKYKLPNQALTDFEQSIYCWIPSTVPASQPFMEIILEKTAYVTLEIYLGHVVSEKIQFKNESGTLGALNIIQDANKFTVSSMALFTDTDGIERVKIVLSSKETTLAAGMFYGYIKGNGYQYSWGLNRIEPVAW